MAIERRYNSNPRLLRKKADSLRAQREAEERCATSSRIKPKEVVI